MESGHTMTVVQEKEEEEAVKETSVRQNRLRSTNERIKMSLQPISSSQQSSFSATTKSVSNWP
jgi:two-component sensor histidine kinase